MSGKVICAKIPEEDWNFIEKSLGDIRISDLVKAALSLFYDIAMVNEPNSSAIVTLLTIRQNLRKQGYHPSSCFKVVVDLYTGRIYCTQ